METAEVCTLPAQVKRQLPPREEGLEVFADTSTKDLTGPECQFRQGARAFLHRELEEAIACLEGAKLTDPRCTPWIDLNIALVMLGDGDHCEEVIQLLRNNPIILKERDVVATRILARAYLKSKQPVMALDLLEKLIEKHPDNHAAHEALGMAYDQMGDYDRALQCFDRAISLKESVARYYRQASGTLRQLGRLTEALHAALAAEKCDSYDHASHELLADIFSDMGDHDGATFHRSYALLLKKAFSEL